MMKIRVLIIILILAKMSVSSKAISESYLPPLKGEIHPSSLFGDFRPGHFHAGIDLRTGGTTGAELSAASDGYIWRVATSFWGYGRVVYLMTNSGHVVTYAHLSRFCPALAEEVYQKQTESKNYKVDLYFRPDQFPIKRGDLIGFSGEAGPGGPHLHYEVRTPANRPINPLDGFLSISDSAPPVFSTLAVVNFGERFDPGSIVKTNQYKCQMLQNNRYGLPSVVNVSERFALEINAFDKIDGYSGKMGVYELKLFFDDNPIYIYRCDTLDFDSFKQANYVRDYKLWWEKLNTYKNPSQADRDQHNYYRLFRVPGDRQPTVKVAIGNGYFAIDNINHEDANVINAGKHNVLIRALDAYGNESELAFTVNIEDSHKKGQMEIAGEKFQEGTAGSGQIEFWGGEVVAEISPGRLYYPQTFTAARSNNANARAKGVIMEFELLPRLIFFKEAVPLKVFIGNRSLPAEKYCLGKSSGGDYSFSGNSISDDKKSISCKIDATGKFALMVDNDAPKLSLISPAMGAKIKYGRQLIIRYRMTDNFSGLGREENLKLYLDDEWVPAEYDPDRNLIEFVMPTKPDKGKHTLHLKVKDQCGNESEHHSHFLVI